MALRLLLKQLSLAGNRRLFSSESAKHRTKIQEQFSLQAVPFSEFKAHSEAKPFTSFCNLASFLKIAVSWMQVAGLVSSLFS